MMDNQIPARKTQQIAGFFLLSISLGFVIWTWYTALTDNYYYPKAAMIFPPFFFIGLGLIIFPDYKTERISKGQDISQLSGLKLLTPRWWVILAVGLLAGLLNFLLIKFI